MMQADYLSQSLSDIDAHLVSDKIQAKQRKKHLRIKAKLLRELEYKTGLNLCKTHWQFSSESQSIEVTRQQMHVIKRVVGNVEEAGVDLAYDYDKTNELEVTVQPIEGLYRMFTFQYRRPHLESDKCQVTKIEIEASSYNRLTCPTDGN